MSRSLHRIVALGAVLVVAACTPAAGRPATGTAASPASPASPASTASPSGAAASPGGSQSAGTPIVVRDFELGTESLTISGSKVDFAVTNEGPTVHNLTVRNPAGTILFKSPDLREGQSGNASGTLQPGSYVMFCSLPGHESLGMKGDLTVTAP